MTRRILVAIVSVTALSVAAFAIPLASIIARLYQEEAVVRLQREATAATIEVPANFRTSHDGAELPPGRHGDRYALYLPNGIRTSGRGPARADEVVRKAATGTVAQARSERLVAAVPVFSREDVIAVVRVSSPIGPLQRRIRTTWAAMAVLGAAIVAAAAALALALARRLQAPIAELVAAAAELGDGDFAARAARSGITELDQAADALNSTAARLGALMERERAFSADASHQLRTPLTGLRLNLEELRRSLPGPEDHVDRALLDVDRLERTISDLVALARDQPSRDPIDLASAFDELDASWAPRLAADGRPLVLHRMGEVPPARVSAAALRQILGVLLSNALEHGAGTVTVTVREVAGAVAIDVSDEGTDVVDADQVFVRRSGDRPGHGIGLALARTLAEAEGGRLLLRDHGPGPTFTVLFPTAAI